MHFVSRMGPPLMLLASLSACGIIGGKERPGTPTVGNRTPILSQISTEMKADPALASTSVVLPPAATNADWPQAGGNAAKAMGHLTLAATPAQAWTASIAGNSNRRRLAAAPVVGAGMLFASDTEGTVHAFDATTGAVRWVHPIAVERDLREANFGGGVSFFEGRVYATSGAGDVVARAPWPAAAGAAHGRVQRGLRDDTGQPDPVALA